MYSQASYDEIRPELKTGDVLLFSGKGFVSWAIKFGSYFGRIRLEHKGHPNFRPTPTFQQAISPENPWEEYKPKQ